MIPKLVLVDNCTWTFHVAAKEEWRQIEPLGISHTGGLELISHSCLPHHSQKQLWRKNGCNNTPMPSPSPRSVQKDAMNNNPKSS